MRHKSKPHHAHTQFESIAQHHHSRAQFKVSQLETFEVFIKRNLNTSIQEQTENTELGMLWLLPCNFQSNGSILTIGTLVDREGPCTSI